MDVEIKSRPPEYGLGRHHPQAATGHGCITVLLLASVKNGGITIAGLDTALLTDAFMDDCWTTVKNAVGSPRSTKISLLQLMSIASELRAKWQITGHPSDGERALPSPSVPTKPLKQKPPHEEDESFVSQVAQKLPPQPWKPGIHAVTAMELGAKPQRVKNAIQILISRGTFMQQRDGVVYDSAGNEFARDATRHTS